MYIWHSTKFLMSYITTKLSAWKGVKLGLKRTQTFIKYLIMHI